MKELVYVCSAFGLAGATGIKAYIPLLGIAVAAHAGLMTLKAPFDLMATWWVISVLSVLCVAEFITDKFPVVDHILHGVHSFVVPVAGAIAAGSQMGNVTNVHPALWLVLGLLCAITVHTTKAAGRVHTTVATVGHGGWLHSLIEDVVAILATVLAIFVPVLAVLVIFAFVVVYWKGMVMAWRSLWRWLAAHC